VTLTVVRISPSHSAFGAVAALFDDYRAHYGWPPSLQLTHDWLHAQVTRQAMMITAALRSGRACGFITVSVLPASLALGTAWSIRDLYVAPAHRRTGIARVLLQQIIDDARQAGAHRVSVQTETGNTPALTLYTAVGFQPVTGLELLTINLARDRQEPRATY
jgi:GNAT superfamily N-acetyltransferase